MTAPKVSDERLREVLHYDPETGVFTWRVMLSDSMPPGKLAGTVISGGEHGTHRYRQIAIDKRNYMAQALAVRYVTGYWPTGPVGFKDGDGLNLRYENLLIATNQQHQHRSLKPLPSNRSGYRGVVKRANGTFAAKIKINMRHKGLGTFPTAEEASAAYMAAKRAVQRALDVEV